MHELSMALSLNNAIEELCARSGWTRVNRLILKFGGLRQVNPELLAFAFEVVSKGTVTEGARLSVIEIPIIFHCRSCGRDTPTENTVFILVSDSPDNIIGTIQSRCQRINIHGVDNADIINSSSDSIDNS